MNGVALFGHNTNSPCTCQSLAYIPSCQHQQSLPSRSILVGEESSGKELFVWRVNFHKSRVANKRNLELLKESLILISGKVLREKIHKLVSIKPRWKNSVHNVPWNKRTRNQILLPSEVSVIDCVYLLSLSGRVPLRNCHCHHYKR